MFLLLLVVVVEDVEAEETQPQRTTLLQKEPIISSMPMTMYRFVWGDIPLVKSLGLQLLLWLWLRVEE